MWLPTRAKGKRFARMGHSACVHVAPPLLSIMSFEIARLLFKSEPARVGLRGAGGTYARGMRKVHLDAMNVEDA